MTEAEVCEILDVGEGSAVKEEAMLVEPDPDVLGCFRPVGQLDRAADHCTLRIVAKSNLKLTLVKFLN